MARKYEVVVTFDLETRIEAEFGYDTFEVDHDSVAEFCRGRIAHHKVPRYVATVDEFPMTVTGKVQKYKLREMAIEQLGLEEAAAIETA